MIELHSIGVARTPYSDWAPDQPLAREAAPDAFRIDLDDEQAGGLEGLERFSHITVLSFLDRASRGPAGSVAPPWAKGREVGLWATRSPNRPNPVGLSVVRLLRVVGCTLFTSPLDLFDRTPVLDIKPYIGTIDALAEANDGWIEDLDGHEHLLQHLRGAPHDHDHGHDHDHDHGHGHE